MQKIQLTNASYSEIIPFNTLTECAVMTIPYLIEGTIALSGGATYSKIFPLWKNLKPDCSKASFFPVDERMAPFESDQSNWGNAYRKFVQFVSKEKGKKHFAGSGADYFRILQTHFKTMPPVFDTIFLGVGTDGHTAGLFPDGHYLTDTKSIILQTQSLQPPVERISLAPRVLFLAREVIIIIAGEHKRAVVREILEKKLSLPIVKIMSGRKRSVLFIEQKLL
jgi:6-phosphogluconolactonase